MSLHLDEYPYHESRRRGTSEEDVGSGRSLRTAFLGPSGGRAEGRVSWCKGGRVRGGKGGIRGGLGEMGCGAWGGKSKGVAEGGI